MAQSQDGIDEGTRRRRRGRILLLVIGVAALAAMASPVAVRWWLTRDLCPTDVTSRGESEGVGWDVARSTCPEGRIVWQLRVVPSKGVSTLAYEAVGGPAPAGWRQTGFSGVVTLTAPLETGETTFPLALDVKGRPLKPVHVVSGRRID